MHVFLLRSLLRKGPQLLLSRCSVCDTVVFELAVEVYRPCSLNLRGATSRHVAECRCGGGQRGAFSVHNNAQRWLFVIRNSPGGVFISVAVEQALILWLRVTIVLSHPRSVANSLCSQAQKSKFRRKAAAPVSPGGSGGSQMLGTVSCCPHRC